MSERCPQCIMLEPCCEKSPTPVSAGICTLQLFSECFQGLFAQRAVVFSGQQGDEQLVLLAVGKEFHFIAQALEAGLFCNACDRGNRLFEKRSGDRAMGYRQQVVRSSLAIAKRDRPITCRRMRLR